MEEETSSSDILTYPGLVEAANSTSELLLSTTSQSRYEAVYQSFIKWKIEKKANSFSENVLLAYFSELKNKYLPSSILSKYSMLHSMIKIQNGVDISRYTKLLAFIKNNSKNFTSKKAKILTSYQIQEFLNKAPNEQYLAIKVSIIL